MAERQAAFQLHNVQNHQQQQQLHPHARDRAFWEQEMRAIEAIPAELSAFKSAELPLARIKKIMKLDDDVRSMMIAAEAPLLFSKAAEIFIRELTYRAWMHTERARRRTLQRNDIALSVGDPESDQFDFLIDIVPRDAPPQQQQHQHQQQQQHPPMHQDSIMTASDSANNKSASSSSSASSGALVAGQQLTGPPAPVQYVIQLPVGAATGFANGSSQLQSQQPVQIFISRQEAPALSAAAALSAAPPPNNSTSAVAADVKPNIATVVVSSASTSAAGPAYTG